MARTRFRLSLCVMVLSRVGLLPISFLYLYRLFIIEVIVVRVGCYIGISFIGALVYAEDNVLIAPHLMPRANY